MNKWYNCEVVQVGASQGKSYIELTDKAASPAFQKTRFYVKEPVLAVAVTAMTHGVVLKAEVDVPNSPPALGHISGHIPGVGLGHTPEHLAKLPMLSDLYIERQSTPFG